MRDPIGPLEFTRRTWVRVWLLVVFVFLYAPIVVLVAGVAGLWAWLARRPAGAPPRSAAVDEAERARLYEEVDALDA